MRDRGLYCTLVFAVCLVQACHPALHSRHLVEYNSVSDRREDCRDVNFKSPPDCDPPDCDFTLAWVDSGQWVNFSLVAIAPSNVLAWAAVGFSGDTLMGDTDVIACCISDQGSPSIHDGWNVPNEHNFLPDTDQSGLRLTAAQINNGKLHCKFSRLKDTGDQQHDRPLTQPWHILAAVGKIKPSSSDPQMLQHSWVGVSQCMCDVTLCGQNCGCLFMNSVKYVLLKLHGAVMSVVFIFFLPTGALLSRYYRLVFNNWFKGHLTMMVMGVACAVTGFALVLGHTGGKFSVGVHQMVGMVCLCLAVIQLVCGVLRPPVGPTLKRWIFKVIHRLLAVTILVLGAAALVLGSYLFRSVVINWIVAALTLALVADLGFILLLEFTTRTHAAITPPVGYHKVTKDDELSDSSDEVYSREGMGGGWKEKRVAGKVIVEIGPGKERQGTFALEKTLCVLFVAQSLGFAIFVGIMILRYGSKCTME